MRLMKNPLFLSILVVLNMVCAPLLAAPASSEPASKPSAVGLLTRAQVGEQLSAARSALQSVTTAPQADSPEGRRRTCLQQRISLLEELLKAITAEESIVALRASLEGRSREAASRLAALAAAPAAPAPSDPNKQAFEQLEHSVANQQKLAALAKEAVNELERRVKALPELVTKAASRSEEAGKQATRLAEQTTATAEAGEKELLDLKVQNARLEQQVAQRTAVTLQGELAMSAPLQAVVAAEAEVAAKALERLEQQLTVHAKALERRLAIEGKVKADEVALKQRAMEAARTPAERFIARMELELAQSRSSQSSLDTFLVRIKQEIVEQQKRFAAEKEELDNLREYMNFSGGSSRAADRIQLTLKQIKLRRRLLRHLVGGDRAGAVAAWQARRFEVEDALFHLRESWNQDRQQVFASLPQQEQATFTSQTDKLLAPYREALQKERGLVGEAVRAGQQLQNLYFERLEGMDTLERFIRSAAFWLRDGKPIGPETFQEIDREFRRLTHGDRGILSRSAMDRLSVVMHSPGAIPLSILLLIVAPLGILLARRRLRRFVARRNDGALSDRASRQSRITVVIVAVVNSALAPAYILLVAATVRWADVPGASTLLAGGLGYAAYPLFIWFLARAMFRERGLAQAQFGMPPDAARCLQRFMRLALLAAVIFLPWWRTLSRPPFELLWLPRIAYTLFELALAAAVILLIRPRSPFVRQWVLTDPEGVVAKQWSMLSVLAIAAILFVFALDVTGYRYASYALGSSLALTLVTLLLLPPLYRSVMRGIESVACRRQQATATVAPGEEPESNEVVQLRLQKFIRMAFILLAMFLLANCWGLDQQAFKTLDDVPIYSVRGAGDTENYVTAADVVRCVLFLVGTFWLLRSLPGIYEFTLFPRLRIEEGLKYAILTISRYSIFAIGVIMAMSQIHLDLGRLGWLMAAIGVGLGFGLQEIVSNFVSGIILLVERPIQVGDLVTIGAMSGTVKRINIRATTILNFDRQEVVVPNRSLITQDVTNWTRGDTTTRLVVPIGAAYGSNVDQVTEVLNRIAQDDPDILDDPAPSVIFMQHGESSLDFNLRVFILSPTMRMAVLDRLNKAINREFARLGIEIPFPQRDLNVKSTAVRIEQIGTDKPHGSG